ncbi:MAG: hypothetical protein ACRDSE_21385 [Pseudonocardiaceae bacterium]
MSSASHAALAGEADAEYGTEVIGIGRGVQDGFQASPGEQTLF